MKYISIVQLISILTVPAIMSTSCKKEGCTDSHAVNFDSKAKKDDGTCAFDATITVNKPTEHSTFYLGDTVHFDVTIESHGELHGYEISLRNKSADAVVFEENAHDHGGSLHFHKMWVVDVADHSDMELTIVVITDHVGGKKTKMVSFHCMPTTHMSH